MSLYNSDELVPPAWINQEFLHKILNNIDNNEGVEILDFDLCPGSMKGDHYASIMFRCRVNYRKGKANAVLNKSFIIKTIPLEEGLKREMLTQSKLFETEIEMYTKTLPAIEKILAACGEPTRLSANIYYHSLEPHKVVVLEDLCESGFDTIRDRFLSEHEIKEVYRKIAKIHAVSYMLGQSSDQHQMVTKYQSGYFNSSLALIDDLLKNGCKNFKEMLSSHAEFKIYLEKFIAMEGKIHQACKDLFDAYTIANDKSDIFVLNHGDFHMKNLMFKFDKSNGNMEDLIMVDYQLSCYAPSTIDMTYSVFLILNPQLRLQRDEIMQFYFTEFLRVLKKINYTGDLPQYSDFKNACVKYRHFTVFMIASILPLAFVVYGKSMEELADIDTTKLVESPEMFATTYHLPVYIEHLRQLLPILLEEGYFD